MHITRPIIFPTFIVIRPIINQYLVSFTHQLNFPLTPNSSSPTTIIIHPNHQKPKHKTSITHLGTWFSSISLSSNHHVQPHILSSSTSIPLRQPNIITFTYTSRPNLRSSRLALNTSNSSTIILIHSTTNTGLHPRTPHTQSHSLHHF
ncbi:hypothetical protein VIGAN_11158400 [Vigna angularis var. angularis]|uniref:Uncharacterized protein n=1 Tax=Vigna angularis var. angularis TaxID=157739 RepID=A0A0S3TB53_PHAAN|nr:hypothetical protein VIGAN_11158400 [Vigna angularis var. angularis]